MKWSCKQVIGQRCKNKFLLIIWRSIEYNSLFSSISLPICLPPSLPINLCPLCLSFGLCLSLSLSVSLSVCLSVSLTRTRTHLHTPTHTYTYTHAHSYTHLHTPTHTRTRIHSLCCMLLQAENNSEAVRSDKLIGLFLSFASTWWGRILVAKI